MATKLGIIIADFTTQLATKILVGGLTGSIQSNLDDDGNTLPNGLYYFTLDGTSSQKEHIQATLTGVNLTNIQSVSRQGVLSAGTKREHRVGCPVVITDFLHIQAINALVNASQGFDATVPIKFDGPTTPTLGQYNITSWDFIKNYVDGVVVSGAPDATTAVKGIVKMSVAPVSVTSPIAIGDNDPRIPTQALRDAMAGTSGAPSGTNKYVTDADTATGGANKVLRAGSDGFISDITDKQGVSLMAGETIAVGDSVMIINELFQKSWSGFAGPSFGNNTIFQIAEKMIPRTTVTSASLRIYLNKFNSPGDNVTVEIQSDNAGSPSNTPITNGVSTAISGAGLTVNPVLTTMNFASPFTLTAGVTYWLVAKRSGAQDASNYYTIGYNATSGFGYANFLQKTYNGTVWSTVNDSPLYFEIVLATGTPSITVWKTDADTPALVDFVGFATSGNTVGNQVLVQTSGIHPNLSGLTGGKDYYPSGTPGAVSLNKGTYGASIGIALNTTSIRINQKVQMGAYVSFATNTTFVAFTDGIVVVSAHSNSGGSMQLTAQVNGVTVGHTVDQGTGNFAQGMMCFPVPKGATYQVTQSGSDAIFGPYFVALS